jgi:hypothetical protein
VAALNWPEAQTVTLQIVGQTDHFIVRFDDAVGAAKAVAQVVLGICESDLLKLTQHMPSTAGSGGDPFTHPPIDVQILNDPAHFGPGFGAADQNGHFPGRQSRIRINPFSAADVKITDTLIVEVASASRLSGGYLQGLTNLELVAAALRDGPLGR